MLRGRIVKLNGISPSTVAAKQSVAWVLEGTGDHLRRLHAGGFHRNQRKLVAKGLQRAASGFNRRRSRRRLGLAIGDEVTVNVLGRDITAKIANNAG